MNLTPMQERAIQDVANWFHVGDRTNEPFFYLAGYAGTGKTTLARYFAEGVDGDVLYAAFTGKAASVMRAAGCAGAQTLHSLLYSSASDAQAELMAAMTRELADPGLTAERRKTLEEELVLIRRSRKRSGGSKLKFTLNPESVLKNAALLVLDECSMVNEALAKDALSFKVPILVLGDPAQLPPVHGTGYFTHGRPDVLLTEVHRQAQHNPILRWATRVREGGTLRTGREEGPDGTYIERIKRGTSVSFDDPPPEGTQILTGKNVVRRNINQRIRQSLGFTSDLPMKGDKLVCLKNDREAGLLNGVLCWAGADAFRVDDESLEMDVLYEGRCLDGLDVSALPFDRYGDPELENEFIDRRFQQFDYGYALTVHKAQGSQWDNVILAGDSFGRMNPGLQQRWLYTAITRASERMSIVY